MIKIKRYGILQILFGQLDVSTVVQNILTLESLSKVNWHSPTIQSSSLNLESQEQSFKRRRVILKSNFSLTHIPLRNGKIRAIDNFYSIWNKNTQSLETFTSSQPILLTDVVLPNNLVDQIVWQYNVSKYRNCQGTKSFNYNLYHNISQPLFPYNRTKLNFIQLELNLENTQLNYFTQRLPLEKQVSRLFYIVYLALMQLSILEDAYSNTKKSYKITQYKVTARISAEEELFMDKKYFATANLNLGNANLRFQDAKYQFKRDIRQNIMNEITIMTGVKYCPIEVGLNIAIKYGNKSRMKLRQRKTDIKNSQFIIIQVKAINEFKMSMSFSVGIVGIDTKPNDIFKIPTNNIKYSVAFNVPKWDYGQQRELIKAQEANIKILDQSLSSQITQIEVDIRSTYRNLEDHVNQIVIAAQNENNVQHTYEIDLELITNPAIEQIMAYAQALINYKIQFRNMKIVLLYDLEQNEPVLPENIIHEK